MFDAARFWETISEAIEASREGQFGFQDEWQSLVSGLADSELAEAAHEVQDHVFALASRASFAAYLIHTGGATEHGFARYCEWILSHGQEAYEEFLSDPQSLAGKAHPRCRWHDVNIYQSILLFISIRARFRPTVSIASFQEESLKNPDGVLSRTVAAKLAPALTEKLTALKTQHQIDLALMESLALDAANAKQELPVLAKGALLESLAQPLVDRRTPMTIHKFWEVLAICRGLGARPSDLRAVLSSLPSAQVAQFHELLRACLVRAATSTLARTIPVEACPEAVMFSIALQGQEVYRSAVHSGVLEGSLLPVCPEFLTIALDVFRGQTGMDLPPIVAQEKFAIAPPLMGEAA